MLILPLLTLKSDKLGLRHLDFADFQITTETTDRFLIRHDKLTFSRLPVFDEIKIMLSQKINFTDSKGHQGKLNIFNIKKN